MDSPNGDSSLGDNEKQRDRGRRGERGTRFSDRGGSDNKDDSRDRSRERHGGGGGGGGGGGNNKRVYVSNIPYEFRWQDLKDLFRRLVGNVEYVEMFTDENGKARGVGIVEFKDPENVGKALEVMNRYQLQGRELVVKEDHGEERDKYGRIARGNGGGMGGGNDGGGNRGGGGMDRGPRRSQGGGGGGGHRDRDDGYLLVVLFYFNFSLFKFVCIFMVLVLSSCTHFGRLYPRPKTKQNKNQILFILAFFQQCNCNFVNCHFSLTFRLLVLFSFYTFCI